MTHVFFSSNVPNIPYKVVQSLSPQTDLLQQNLYLQICRAHPQILQQLFKNGPYNIESRDSQTWVNSVALIIAMIDTPLRLPEDCVALYTENKQKFFEELSTWILPRNTNKTVCFDGITHYY